MKRLFKATFAAGLCLAVSAMFIPVEQASAQFRVYAGPGGVGIGYGNTGYGNLGYGNFGYGYGTRGYRGNAYGFYPRYNDNYPGVRSYYRGNSLYNGYRGYGNRSYGSPYYSNRGNTYNYAPRSNYSYRQSSPGYYAAQAAPPEDTRPDRPVMGIRIRSAGEGVRVVTVQPNSPAAEAGLQEGDLITSFNGQRVTTEQALLSELDKLAANANAQLSVRSGNRTWDTSMQLTTYQEAFVDNVAEGNQDQRRTVGRPLLDDERTPDALQRENEQLRREVERLRGADDDALDIGEPPVDLDTSTEETINPGGNIVPNPPAGPAQVEENISPGGNVAPNGETAVEE